MRLIAFVGIFRLGPVSCGIGLTSAMTPAECPKEPLADGRPNMKAFMFERAGKTYPRNGRVGATQGDGRLQIPKLDPLNLKNVAPSKGKYARKEN
jgi:hypothetical protein